MYRPEDRFFGGFTPNGGTIEFYGRIKALARAENVVLDFGAGRGAWFEDDVCVYRREIQSLKGHVREVIAADIDEVVEGNRSSDRNVLIKDTVPLPDASLNMIIADYVLEHVQDPVAFANEVRRLLKPSGFLCARTPHKYCYVAIAARIIPNSKHTTFLSGLQPDRKSEDVFPTCYKINTLKDIKTLFRNFEDGSYIFRADPAYFFGNQSVHRSLELLHHLTPTWFSGNIFAFLRKLA